MILVCLEPRFNLEISVYILVLGCISTKFLVDLCSTTSQECLKYVEEYHWCCLCAQVVECVLRTLVFLLGETHHCHKNKAV